MDLTESDKEITITAELPGLDEKDFEVTVAGDLLTLKGDKKVEEEQRNGDSYHVERRYGSFSRSVRLPFEVQDQAVEAKYDKGVLTVRVPKPAELQPLQSASRSNVSDLVVQETKTATHWAVRSKRRPAELPWLSLEAAATAQGLSLAESRVAGCRSLQTNGRREHPGP